MLPCNWQLTACGINYKTSALEEREPLQIGAEEIPGANASLCNITGVLEGAILSTCNRVEFFFVCDRERDSFEIVEEFYRDLRNIDIAPLREKFYIYHDRDVADHLFRVTAGIDSMVIGENQIQSQVKEAYSSACKVKSAGKVLHGLLHQAFRVGKQVRADTELGRGACSVSSATVDMLKTRMNGLVEPTIVFVGINQMIFLAASRLHHRGKSHFIFANRTKQKAHDFAARFRGAGYSLGELPHLLIEADVLITCTSATNPIIDDRTLEERTAAKIEKRLIIADMAIPRDVALKNDYANVEVYDLEAVKKYVRESQQIREKAVPQAEQLINYRVEQFVYWFEHIRFEPGYNGLSDAFEQVRRQELSKILGTLPDEVRQTVDQATRRMVQKLTQIKFRSDPPSKEEG